MLEKSVISNVQVRMEEFLIPNGDVFCYDKRNGKIVFFEHEVFDTGVYLNGLILADSFDCLLENGAKCYLLTFTIGTRESVNMGLI